MSVDLPDPDAPTIATNSPRVICRETSASARTVSPVGRVYVLSIACSSIIDGILWLDIANQHLVALAQAVDDFPVVVVSAAGSDQPALDEVAAPVHDERLIGVPAYGSDGQRQYVLARLERDPDRGGHFGTQRAID